MIFAKEPDDRDAHASFNEHIACLFEKDGWTFSLIYAITFGGFIGLATFLPTYYYDQSGVSKIQAGQLTMLAAFMGAAVRVLGGWISDRWGGVNTLMIIVYFAALGAGNGVVFQLVPLRWPMSTAVAGSMIGEIGALGGGLVPSAMGLSKQYMGSYSGGFFVFSALSVVMLSLNRSRSARILSLS